MPRTTFRVCLAALVALLAAAVTPARAQTEQQALVDRAALTIQEMMSDGQNPEARQVIKSAKGAMVCPRVFKAGFIIGGQGGSCTLSGKMANGQWTAPAFYGLASGSVGFQIGIQDAQIVFIVLTDKGLRALMDSQFKVGADASVAVATIGAGVQGSTTAALRADIVAFSIARGLFAGISLDGSLISSKPDWNSAYYGQSLTPQSIVLEGAGQNPGAEPLKEMLARSGG